MLSSTSPSVYVAYKTLAAGYFYGDGCPWTIGPRYQNITRAYPPNYLMTLPMDCDYHEGGKEWSVLRIRDLLNPPQNWISDQGCFYQIDGKGGPTGRLGSLSPNGTEMAARPVLSYPPDIGTLNSVWASAGCTANVYEWGFDDPPRVLTPVSAMAPATTKSLPLDPGFSEGRTSSTDPAPASTLAADPALKTAPPGNVQITRSPPNPKPTQATSTALAFVLDPPVKPSPANALLSEPAYHPPSYPTKIRVLATLGSKPIYVVPDGGISLAGTCIRAGDPAVTVDNTPITVDSKAIYVGTSSYIITTGLNPAPGVIAGQTLKADGSGGIVIGTKMIQPGQQFNTNGIHVSVGQDDIVIDGANYAMPPRAPTQDGQTPPTESLPIVGGQTMSVGPNGAVIIGDSTLSAGEQTYIHSTSISVGLNMVLVGGKTYAMPSSPNSEFSTSTSFRGNPASTMGAEAHRAGDGDAVFLGDSSLASSQHTITGDSYISVGSDRIVIGGNTYDRPIAVPASAANAISALTALADGQAVSIAQNGAIVLGDLTVSPGQHTIINGVYLSAHSDSFVVGGNTLGAGGNIVAGMTYPLPEHTGIDGETTYTNDPLGSIIEAMLGFSPSSSPISMSSSTPEAAPKATSATISANASSLVENLSLPTGSQDRTIGDSSLLFFTFLLCIYSTWTWLSDAVPQLGRYLNEKR